MSPRQQERGKRTEAGDRRQATVERQDDNFRECTALHCFKAAAQLMTLIILLIFYANCVMLLSKPSHGPSAAPRYSIHQILPLHLCERASAVAASRVCGEAIQTIAGIIIMATRGTIWGKALGLLNELKTLQGDGKVGAVQGA